MEEDWVSSTSNETDSDDSDDIGKAHFTYTYLNNWFHCGPYF